MRKKYIISTILGILLGVIVFYNVYEDSPRKYISEDVTFLYSNEKIQEKNYDDVLNFFNQFGNQIDSVKFKKIQKEIKSIYILSYDSVFTSRKRFGMILNIGIKQIMYIHQAEKYFDKVDNYYIMKDEIKEKFNLAEYGINEIYMMPNKGNLIFATEREVLLKILEDEENSDNDLIEILEKTENKKMGTAIFNLKKDSVYDIENIVFAMDYKNGNYHQEIDINLLNKDIALDIGEEERVLDQYIDKDRLYMCIDRYDTLFYYLLKLVVIDRNYSEELNEAKNETNITLREFLKNVDKEFVYDFDENSGIIKMKNNENVDRMNDALITYLKNKKETLPFKVDVKENEIIIGEHFIKKSENALPYLKSNQFLYMNNMIGNEILKVEGFISQGNIKIEGIASRDYLINRIKKYLKDNEDEENDI